MREFRGKTAVVTGGASGIGLALAEQFADLGMNVVIADIETASLDKAVSDLKARGAAVIGKHTDTMSRESVRELLEAADAQFGPVHILCNNAGVGTGTTPVPLWETTDEDWQWVMGVNFWGVLHGIQVFVPHMLAHGEPGHIVNTASLAALIPGSGPYSVSKHAVLATTEGLHMTLKRMHANLSASVVCPGMVNTNIWDAERNRPERLRAGEVSREGAEAMRTALMQGLPARAVADQVLQAIIEDRLYVLPHPAWDETIRARVEHILGRQGPVIVDWADLQRRAARGEVF